MGESTYPFSNFNVAAVEVWELIKNFIPHFSGYVIIHPHHKQPTIGQPGGVHEDAMGWKHYSHNRPFVRQIYMSPLDCPHIGWTSSQSMCLWSTTLWRSRGVIEIEGVGPCFCQFITSDPDTCCMDLTLNSIDIEHSNQLHAPLWIYICRIFAIM